MKLHILSDLHLEGYNFKIKECETDADVLILAGDIGRLDGIHKGVLQTFLVQCKELYENVIYIAGNHEFYNSDLYEGYYILETMCAGIGINFLQNSEVTIDGIKFFGSTAWTDVNMLDKKAINAVEEYLMDFRIITIDGKPITVQNMYDENQMFRYCMKNTDANVIITHHVPNREGINPKWAGQDANYGFMNTDLVTKGEAWFFGHTHDSIDYWKDGTHFVCNPRGYGIENYQGFDPMKVVEI